MSTFRRVAERVKRYLDGEELSSIYPQAGGIVEYLVACINEDEAIINDYVLDNLTSLEELKMLS